MGRIFSAWIGQTQKIFISLSKFYPERITPELLPDKNYFKFPLKNGCNGMAKYLSIAVHPNEEGNRIIDNVPAPISIETYLCNSEGKPVFLESWGYNKAKYFYGEKSASEQNNIKKIVNEISLLESPIY